MGVSSSLGSRTKTAEDFVVETPQWRCLITARRCQGFLKVVKIGGRACENEGPTSAGEARVLTVATEVLVRVSWRF